MRTPQAAGQQLGSLQRFLQRTARLSALTGPPAALFTVTLVALRGHECHTHHEPKLTVESEPCSQPAGDRTSHSESKRQSTVSRSPKCLRVLPSFAGMHHPPSDATLQTHVHVTSRTPQLHRRDCMAQPEKHNRQQERERDGGVVVPVSVSVKRGTVRKPSVSACVREERRKLVLCG